MQPNTKPFSDVATNRYDIYSLKGALDDEIISVIRHFYYITYPSDFSGLIVMGLWRKLGG